jgi:hypothetical protein
MRYFIDTEFREERGFLEMLTIGIVAEDGRELYAIDDMAVDRARLNASGFVKDQVLPYVAAPLNIIPMRGSLLAIGDAVRAFVAAGGSKPVFWGWFADYDWVLFCWLQGRMIDLPPGWPQYCRDLKQVCDSLGNPKLPSQPKKHHALSDARWVKAAYDWLASQGDFGL